MKKVGDYLLLAVFIVIAALMVVVIINSIADIVRQFLSMEILLTP